MLRCSWGFLSIHTEPIHPLAAPPALFPVSDATHLEKSAWRLSFHRQLSVWVLKKQLTQHIDKVHTVLGSQYYKCRGDKAVSAMACTLALINIHELFGGGKGVGNF